MFIATSAILDGPASASLLLAILLLLPLGGDLEDDLEYRELLLCGRRDASRSRKSNVFLLSRRRDGDVGLRASFQPPSRRPRKLPLPLSCG